MRDYATVAPQFWTGITGKTIREYGADAQRVALYLMTCPSANALGLYYLPLPTLCHEVGIIKEGASKALRCLSEAHFSYYDTTSEYVWVPEMARFQIGESLQPGDKRVKWVIKELMSLSKTPFFNDFLEKYRVIFRLQELELMPKKASPFDAPSIPHRSQEQEQEQEQDNKLPLAQREKTATERVDGFEEFWKLYPRKIGKASALKAWSKHYQHGVIDKIRSTLAWEVKCDQWTKDGGQFIPHPDTWLNQERWNDEQEQKPAPTQRKRADTCICCKAPHLDGKRSCKCVIMLSGQHNFCPIHEGKCRVCCGCEPGKEPF